MTEPVPSYVGEHAQIGGGKGGMKPLAQNGKVVIVNGGLQLIGTQGQVIDQAPIEQVELATSKMAMGGAMWVTLAGERRYSVAIGAGGMMLFAGILRIFRGASGGKKLKAAVEAEQARAK